MSHVTPRGPKSVAWKAKRSMGSSSTCRHTNWEGCASSWARVRGVVRMVVLSSNSTTRRGCKLAAVSSDAILDSDCVRVGPDEVCHGARGGLAVSDASSSELGIMATGAMDVLPGWAPAVLVPARAGTTILLPWKLTSCAMDLRLRVARSSPSCLDAKLLVLMRALSRIVPGAAVVLATGACSESACEEDRLRRISKMVPLPGP
mmetsp:Transcript_30170/g.81075  ORF Transcript_30170/g.81075 Transcript_30170/m.81075 type:complete len:204 (+) Transcript_30170:758-1369(+)